MLLKEIKLNNIRSYLNQRIEFPAGSLLLSGDIGSGKSTILLAIEFALFGAKGKELSGASLLRNGKKEGYVELNFEIDKKNVWIKRKLKRSKNDVRQDSGHIIINNVKKEGMPTELKTKVINLMGYPKALVSKSKDLVYRYTVYTPQENMKNILFEDKELRLDTLRRVFGIDKYKRVRENVQIYLKEIKEKKKEFEGKISDLEEKKKQKREREHEIKEFEIKINELMPKLRKIRERLKEEKKLLEKTEKKINEFNRLKREFEISEFELRNKIEQRQNGNEQIKLIDESISLVEKELKDKNELDKKHILKDIKEKENELSFMEKTFLEITKKITEFESRKKHSEKTKQDIAKIDKCPVCQQEVGSNHKEFINEKEGSKIKEIEAHISLHSKQEKNAEKKINEIKKQIELLRENEKEVQVLFFKKQRLDDKKKEKEKLIKQQEMLKKDIGKINIKKIGLNKKIDGLENIEKEYSKIRKGFDSVREDEKKVEIEKNNLERDKINTKKIVEIFDKEIREKEKIKEKINYLNEIHNWLDNSFINLMTVMEKNIMLKIYGEFNELLQNWFNILIEDEAISIRLDDEFSPVIEQNGYETEIMHLSGGEKTSCALAYRLALNKVINDFIGDIKTKELIILDEPTDGFSTEQLDKVRAVLDQLDINQIIIVSHETKIESFVDNVIRISKEEHVSCVID